MYTNSNVGCIESKPIKHISQMLKIQDVHGFSFNTKLNDIKIPTNIYMCIQYACIVSNKKVLQKFKMRCVYCFISSSCCLQKKPKKCTWFREFFIPSFNAYLYILYKLMNFPFILYSVSKMIGSLMLMFFPI